MKLFLSSLFVALLQITPALGELRVVYSHSIPAVEVFSDSKMECEKHYEAKRQLVIKAGKILLEEVACYELDRADDESPRFKGHLRFY